LKECDITEEDKYLDLPNKFQVIFDLYKSLPKEKYEWMEDVENKDYKQVIICFMIQNADK